MCTWSACMLDATSVSIKASKPKMKLEMPRSFTDHPLSRKVERLESYAKILYMLDMLQ